MAQFSDPHLAALAVLAIAIVGSVWTARHRPGSPTRVLAVTLAGLILAAWAGEYVADAVTGTWNARSTLPLQLTDAVSLVSAVALLSRNQLAVELTYFWSLSATLQAIITPDLGQNFPSVYYFTYFGYHIGAVVAGCLLVFGCGQYPRRHAAWRVFGLTLVWAAIAGAGDVITGGNYMYLAFRPQHNSLLGLFGPWPLYIAGGAVIGLAMLLALQWLAGWAARHDRRGRTEARAGGAATAWPTYQP